MMKDEKHECVIKMEKDDCQRELTKRERAHTF